MSRSVSFLFPLALSVCLCSTQTAQADLVAYSNFNTLVENTNNGVTYVPDTGDGMLTLVGFTSDGISSKAGSTINAILPDLAGQNLTLMGEDNNGAMLIYAVDLTVFADPILTFADRRTGSGFNSIQVSYSTDGTTFVDFGSAYDPTTGNYGLRTIDLSSANVLDGAATAFVKFTLGGASSPGGQYRLDNVQINANSTTAIPEPSRMAVSGAMVALIIGFGLRRKHIAKIVAE